MGRLDRQVGTVAGLLGEQVTAGVARRLDLDEASGRFDGEGPSLVLADEAGLELGSPAAGSLALLAWTEGDLCPLALGVYLAGPDLQVDVGQRVGLHLVGDEDTRHLLQADRRLGSGVHGYALSPA